MTGRLVPAITGPVAVFCIPPVAPSVLPAPLPPPQEWTCSPDPLAGAFPREKGGSAISLMLCISSSYSWIVLGVFVAFWHLLLLLHDRSLHLHWDLHLVSEWLVLFSFAWHLHLVAGELE